MSIQNMVTIKQAAAVLQVSDKTVRRWITAGIIHAERVGPRFIRVDVDSVRTRSLTPMGHWMGDAEFDKFIADAEATGE